MENVLLITAGTLTALFAGLLYGFSVAVNPGLRKLDNRGYLSAMKAINVVIVNPVFMLSFLGPIFLLPLVAFLNIDDGRRFTVLLVAAILFILGGIVVTARGNLPLNNRLDSFALDAASDVECAEFRGSYEQPWNRWHAVRTLATIAATVLVFTAAVL